MFWGFLQTREEKHFLIHTLLRNQKLKGWNKALVGRDQNSKEVRPALGQNRATTQAGIEVWLESKEITMSKTICGSRGFYWGPSTLDEICKSISKIKFKLKKTFIMC